MAGFLIKMSLVLQSFSLFPTKMRPWLLRLLGINVGSRVWIFNGVRFFHNNIDIGDDVGINSGCFLESNGRITLGKHVRLGPDVMIITATHDIEDGVIRRKTKKLIVKPVTIEDGCWLQARAVVLPGVTVRSGCVIAVSAVVTKDTKPNGYYAGIPARRTRELPV